MTEHSKVNVEFFVKDRDAFLVALQTATSYNGGMRDLVIGYRADDHVQRRSALETFANQMEIKLRKNDHKSSWRDKPIEALFKLLLLEVEEFRVAYDYFTVGEARPELVDIANFALIVSDRLSLLDQDRNAKEQQK